MAKGEGDGKFWAADDGWLRCDTCMRGAWRVYNEAARKGPSTVSVKRNVTMPKGWGF